MTTTPRATKTSAQVFATSNFTTLHWVDGWAVREPAGIVHAKALGTVATLCGLPSISWQKFLDTPFAKVTGRRCPDCYAAYLRELVG